MSEVGRDGFRTEGLHRIHEAAAEGDVKAIQRELGSGVSVDIEGRGIWSGATPLYMAARAGRTEAVIFLLEHCKANPNKPERHGWSPLMKAAQNGHDEAVKLLLDHRADKTLKST